MSTNPNLIFVFADAFRHCAIGGKSGFDPVLTPNLNRLAQQGATMTHAVSNYPVCSPYRAMLMTGQFPQRNGVIGNCCTMTGCEGNYLRPQARTFTDALAGAGYSVGYIGKWHLEKPIAPYVGAPDRTGAVWNEFTPPDRRHGIGFWCGYNTYDNHFQPEYWLNGHTRTQRTRANSWSPKFETDVGLAVLVNERQQFRKAGDPFALFMSFNPPHTPFEQVPPELLKLYEGKSPADLLTRENVDLADPSLPSTLARKYAANYFAAISGIDDQVGRMLDGLDKLNLANNTLVVFTSDHGEMMGSHRLMYKGYAYDESIRVPFLARLPGTIPAGHVSDVLMGAPDVMPTLLDTMGFKSHTPTVVDGISVASELLGQRMTDRPESLFIMNNAAGWRGVRTERYTFSMTVSEPVAMQLFDNDADPMQMQNLADTLPTVVATLRERTLRWMSETGDTALPEQLKQSA